MSGWSAQAVGFCGFGLLCFGASSGAQEELVDLEWRPDVLTVGVGETAEIGLYAVAAVGDNIPISGLQAILAWEPEFLGFAGHIDNGPYDWLLDGFEDDSALDDLNAGLSDPPPGIPDNDGDAFYTALSQLSVPAVVNTDGLLVTTMRFDALAVTGGTEVCIAETAGLFTISAVLGGGIDVDLTGALGCATITVTPEPATLTWSVIVMALLRRRSHGGRPAISSRR